MKRTLLATALLAGMTTTAMAVDFTKVLKTFDGKDFIDQTGAPAPQVLGTVAENSLMQSTPSDSIEEKNRRFFLALKIHEHPKDPNLSAEELAMIKKAIGTYEPIAIMGQAIILLDPASVPKN